VPIVYLSAPRVKSCHSERREGGRELKTRKEGKDSREGGRKEERKEGEREGEKKEDWKGERRKGGQGDQNVE
jgi:hypothetical protein